MPNTSKAISGGLLVLFLAFLFPMLISAPSSGVAIEDTTLNGTGDSNDVGDSLNILLDSKTSDTAFLNVTSLVSGNSTQISVTEGENNTFQLDGQDITITALNIQQGTSGDVDLRVRYPSTFSWDEDSQRLSENLPTVMASLALFMVTAYIVAVVRS